MKGLFSLVFLFMVPALCTAQGASQPGDRHLQGMVLDEQELAISGAQIVVTQQQGSLRKTAVSSTTQFRIDGLVPAVYEVRVAAPGFALKIETVDLRTVPEATLDIRLEAGRVTEQVIVTPTRSEQSIGRRARQRDRDATAKKSGSRRPSSPTMSCARVPTFSLFRRTSSLSSHPTVAGRVAPRNRAERHEPHAGAD